MRADGVRQAAIGIGVLLALGGPAGAQEWTAQEIVDRAVARADAQRDAQDDIRYRATFEAITERLNGDGEVEETERVKGGAKLDHRGGGKLDHPAVEWRG